MSNPNEDIIYDEHPIHDWFGLSYASWLVLPRVLMENMSLEWQDKMVALLDEFNAELDWLPESFDSLWVQGRDKNGKICKLPEELCNYRRPRPEDLIRMKRSSSKLDKQLKMGKGEDKR